MTVENETPSVDALDEAFAGLDFEKVRAAVPEDYRSVLEPIKTPKALIDSFVNAQKLVGKKNENAIPGEKATPEEIKAFYKKLGAGDPEEYVFEDIKLPEDRLKTLQETFANNNLTKKQAAEVLRKFNELEQTVTKAEEAKFNQFKEEQLKERGLKYGEKLEENNNLVNHAINKLAGENKEFAEALQSLTIDNQYFEMFKKMGSLLEGADPNGPQDKNSGSKNLTIRQQIDELISPDTKSGRIYLGLDRNTDNDERAKITNQLKDLYKKLAEEK